MASDVMHGLPSPSRGRSRASARSCYSTVSPSPEELWTEQQTELAPIYATPGTPYPLPWPPRCAWACRVHGREWERQQLHSMHDVAFTGA